MPKDQKRKQMRDKIEAGERRNAERTLGDYAREARDGAASFVKEHPITTVLGGLAIGVVVASLIPGPGKRLRKKATARGSALAAMLTELGMAYGASMLDGLSDAARAGQDKLEDLGDTARGLRREAGELAGSTSDRARALSREAGKKAGRSIRDLRARMSH